MAERACTQAQDIIKQRHHSGHRHSAHHHLAPHHLAHRHLARRHSARRHTATVARVALPEAIQTGAQDRMADGGVLGGGDSSPMLIQVNPPGPLQML